MKTRLWILLAATATLSAQQVVAPTPETAGTARGENHGNYNISNSFELGYRWSLIGGSLGEYRSDVNYGNGVRLLGSSFSIDSKDGHGRYFDQILLNTIGLGNDPYQSATLRVQKNGLYRYDMNWRLNDYYNPALTVAGGLHRMDTERRMQDHDFTLFPQAKFRMRAGYSRNVQDGPALSTSLELDNNSANSAGLPVFSDLRRLWNEYRLGADMDVFGFKLTLLRRWDFFKEDTPYRLFAGSSAASLGLAGDLTEIQQFAKAAPVHGRNPGWLATLMTNRRRWAVNARISYTEGHNNFALGESASGVSRFGGAATRQIAVLGNADRPMVAGDLNFVVQPTGRLTVTNNTSVNSLRISGPSSYTDVLNGFNTGQTAYFRYLGIRTVTNSTDANYRVKEWVAFYAGYRYTNRLVRTIEDFSLPDVPDSAFSNTYRNTNRLQSGTLGVRFRPVKNLTANLEGEVARAEPSSDSSERPQLSYTKRAHRLPHA